MAQVAEQAVRDKAAEIHKKLSDMALASSQPIPDRERVLEMYAGMVQKQGHEIVPQQTSLDFSDLVKGDSERSLSLANKMGKKA